MLEAVVEELDIKHQVFTELAAATNPECVLATNTSSLTVAAIAAGTPDPSRVVGLHFFNPPHQMPLVEVVRGPQSNPQTVATAAALAARIGKTLVLVDDCAGFLVNRMLAPYMNEAGHLVAEVEDPAPDRSGGRRIRHADGAARADRPGGAGRVEPRFGKPAGGVRRADGTGPHLAGAAEIAPRRRKVGRLKVIEKTWFGKRLNPAVQAAISRPGRQSATQKAILSHEEIIQRLVYPLINEAARCLDERIVERPTTSTWRWCSEPASPPFAAVRCATPTPWAFPRSCRRSSGWRRASPRFAPCEPVAPHGGRRRTVPSRRSA